MKILVINGANMNMLGIRAPEKYGHGQLKDLEKELYAQCFPFGIELEMFQSNIEGEIVGKIHSAYKVYDGIIINAGAYAHTSIAIRDAIEAVKIPTVEVHMTNIYAREDFRQHSHIAPVAIGQISGFGFDSYKLALTALQNHINAKQI